MINPEKLSPTEVEMNKNKDVIEEIKKYSKEINNIIGVELDVEQFKFKEKLSTELSDEEQKIVRPDMLGFFNYKKGEIVILQDRVKEISNEMEKLFKAARFQIQGEKRIREFVRKYSVIHELVHAAHFANNETTFKKQDDDLQQITALSQEIFKNQQELQSIILQLENLSKEGKIDLGTEIKDLPDNIRQKAEKVKELSAGIVEKNSKFQALYNNFLTVFVFSEAIADVVTHQIANNENMGDAYYLLIGKSPEYKNLGILRKIIKKAIEFSIKVSCQKRGCDPMLLELRLRAIEFIENIIQQEFKGNIKTSLHFVIENPPSSLDEIKDFKTYLKRCKPYSGD